MKLSSFGKFITGSFTDIMDVYKYSPSKNDDGTTDIKLASTPLLASRPCRLSYIKLESPGDSQVDSTPVLYMPKLFFLAEDKISVGDYIKVSRISDTGEVLIIYEGQIGLPSVFVTHCEALFRVDGVA